MRRNQSKRSNSLNTLAVESKKNSQQKVNKKKLPIITPMLKNTRRRKSSPPHLSPINPDRSTLPTKRDPTTLTSEAAVGATSEAPTTTVEAAATAAVKTAATAVAEAVTLTVAEAIAEVAIIGSTPAEAEAATPRDTRRALTITHKVLVLRSLATNSV